MVGSESVSLSVGPNAASQSYLGSLTTPFVLASTQALPNQSPLATIEATELLFKRIKDAGSSFKSVIDKLNSDELLALELRYLALLDLGNLIDAKIILKFIHSRFPSTSSLRSRLLSGIWAEANHDFESALEIYNVILDHDECYAQAYKRCAAVYIRQGDRKSAIHLILVYLDAGFYSDIEAWVELAQLYSDQGNIAQAIHCYEEILLLAPNDHIYLLKYADLLYTAKEFVLAQKYYSAILFNVKNHPRALIGLRLTQYELSKLNSNNATNNKSFKQIKQQKDNENEDTFSNPLEYKKELSILVKKGINEHLNKLDKNKVESKLLKEWLDNLE